VVYGCEEHYNITERNNFESETELTRFVAMVGCREVEGELCVFLNQFIAVTQTHRHIGVAVGCHITYCTQYDLGTVELAYTHTHHVGYISYTEAGCMNVAEK